MKENINWDNIIPIIENALNVKLYEWQKLYLKYDVHMPIDRRIGKTMTYCIKSMLALEGPIGFWDIYKHRDENGGPAYHKYFIGLFINLWMKLKKANLPVIEIMNIPDRWLTPDADFLKLYTEQNAQSGQKGIRK